MSRGGALMGKRALVTHVSMSTHTNREGFTIDPFWGATAPRAISEFGAAIESGGRDKLRAALGLAVQDLEGKEIDEDALLEIGTPLFVGARAVLCSAVRANAQESDVVRDLGSLKIQEDCSQDILMALSRGRERLTRGAQLGLRFPAVEDVRWRVDVTISNTALSRVLRPSVLFQMQLSDGALESFTMSAEQLQTLRYDVACALRSLQVCCVRFDAQSHAQAAALACLSHCGQGDVLRLSRCDTDDGQDLHASPQLSKLAAARSDKPSAALSSQTRPAAKSSPPPAKQPAPEAAPQAAPVAAAPALPTF